MQRFFRDKFSLSPALVVAIAALVVALGGVAYATIPDSGGVIHGCYLKANGSLRVIDPSAGEKCTKREAAIQWSQTGPKGPPGSTGATGPAGPPATSLWAVVGPDGSLLGGSNVTSAYSFSPGNYEVTFNRDVTTCGAIATINGNVGDINTHINNPGAGTVYVGTNSGAGPGEAMGFTLAVFC